MTEEKSGNRNIDEFTIPEAIVCSVVRNVFGSRVVDSYAVTTARKEDLNIRKISKCVKDVRKILQRNIQELLDMGIGKTFMTSSNVDNMSCTYENMRYTVWFKNNIPHDFEEKVKECFSKEEKELLAQL